MEDFRAFGKGALKDLQWIGEGAFGEGHVTERNFFKWKTASTSGSTWRGPWWRPMMRTPAG